MMVHLVSLIILFMLPDGPQRVIVSSSPYGGIIEGNSVILTCSSDANPPVESYTWFKRSGTGDVQMGSGQSYRIDNISPSDSNKYKCRASNRHGSAFSKYIPLDVLYSPKETSVSVTLRCNAFANPPVTDYTWFREGKSEPVAHGETYSISSITKEDITPFYCQAGNRIGHSFARLVPVTYTEQGTYAAVGIGGFCGGLVVAVLVTILWSRWKKKQTTNGNDIEAGESRRKKHNTANENDYKVRGLLECMYHYSPWPPGRVSKRLLAVVDPRIWALPPPACQKPWLLRSLKSGELQGVHCMLNLGSAKVWAGELVELQTRSYEMSCEKGAAGTMLFVHEGVYEHQKKKDFRPGYHCSHKL
ncbi:hypothetical protein NFI96_030609, partial [Prochilodus magdalenae]